MTPGTVDAATEEEDEERDEADGENEQTNGEGEEGGSDEEDEQDGIRLWLLQVCILANHLNGKDTHIRRIVVFGPKTSPTASTGKGTAGALKRIRDVSLDATANSRSKSRTAVGNNGSDVTLAQLLSLQTQADAQGAEEAANADAAPTPPRRSALNLFGSIR
jgi:anaphase-promoting complex subunit 10